MAIRSGKPGTIRVTGIQRAQLQKINLLLEALLKYNVKLSVRVPPVVFLSPSDATEMGICQIVMEKYIDLKNV